MQAASTSNAPLLEPTHSRSVLVADIRTLLTLAMPIIGITLSRMLMGFADFYQVSFLGTEATAAISPATLFVFMALCLGMGVVTSVQTFASQALGRGEPREASGYAWQTMYIAVFTIPIAFAMTLISDAVWAGIDAPAAVRAMEADYCRVAFWSVPFGVACAGLEGFFNGVQKPGVALKAIIAALITNVVGNYLLIFGKCGFPELGITGAAIATIFGWVVRLVVLGWVFFSAEFRDRFGTRANRGLDGNRLLSTLKIGGPTAIQWVLDVGAWFLFLAVIMQGFGTATLAASNVGIQFMHVAFMPAIGVGVALCTLVGHAIGEGKPDVAMRKTKAALIVTGSYMGFIGLFFLLIPRLLMSLVSDDQAVIDAGVGILIWAALFQVSDALCIVYINALRGAGDTKWPAVVLVLLCWTVFMGGGYGMVRFVPQMGLHGPWMICTLYITILGVVLWRRFAHGAWRQIRLFEAKPEASGAVAASIEGSNSEGGLAAIDDPFAGNIGVHS
ncbi:MAG: MATE family efflux transporter [Phycisphaerae bacterium]|nr:MATE family efflux transporter [Phycisphaerae bacterium]